MVSPMINITGVEMPQAESSRQAAQHADQNHLLHRGQKACQACRIAKVKCHEVLGHPACARCQSAAIQCIFPASRRGRVKGSKNKKTLEKLAQSAGSEDNKPELSEAWASPDDQPASRNIANVAPSSIDDSPDSRPTSPFDPFITRPVTPTEPDEKRPVKRARFSRHTLEQLEKTFPTGIERDVEESLPHHISPSQQDLQNPLHFLAECARRGWDSQSRWSEPLVIPRPASGLPWEDQVLLDHWQGVDVQRMAQDQKTFFQHGLYGSKRDVSVGLDAVQRGVIPEDQVGELFASYFKTVHPGFPLLDERLHTPSFVRSRSAYLFTTILAIGATSIATLSHATNEQTRRAMRLHAHIDKLQLVLCATAAKSVEIIQAEIMLQSLALRKPRLVDDQRWTRLGMCSRMASLIGLFRPLAQKLDDLDHDPLAMNDFRLRVTMILLESRWESIADRKPISPEFVELNDKEFDKLNRTDPLSQDALLASDYALHRFELESKERIDRIAPGSRSSTCFDSERIWIKTYIEEWEKRWVEPQIEPLKRWYFQYTAYRSNLVGLLRIAKKQSATGKWSGTMRREVLDVSIRMLEGALKHDRSLHMLRPTSPLVFACTIVLQLSEQDHPARNLILRIALRLSGNPRGEVMTYGKHNGFQILNMLCLSKETAEQRRASVSPRIVTGPDPISSLQQTLLAPAGPPQSLMNGSNGDGPANGWSDLDQLLGYSGNVDFPYFPGEVTNVQPAVANDPAHTQWNDLFSGFSANGWDNPASGSLAQDAGTSNMWGGGALGMGDASNQFGAEGRVNDFLHHIASALGG